VSQALVPFTTRTGGVCLQHRARYVMAVPDADGGGGAEKGGPV
jgi:hypothetical protein